MPIKMRKLLITMWLVCGLVSSACAEIVYFDEEWVMEIGPGDSITCVSYFIPDIPNVPDSLIFAQLPELVTILVPEALSWNTALADGGKTAYLFGPEITNDGLDFINVFSYQMYYQWDDEDVVEYPIYLDTVVFDDDEVVYDSSRRGTPDSYEESEDNLDGPYENPVPEPMTIWLLGLGAFFVRKRALR